MATMETVKLFIPGIGHVFHNEVDSEEMEIDSFNFSDPLTYGTWTWLGDTSQENTIEFETEGGEAEQKHTWDREGVRTIYTPETMTGTVNALSLTKETFDLAFAGGTYDAAKKKYTVKGKKVAATKAIMIVCEDGLDVMAFRFPKLDISGSFPSFDIENFLEIPLDLQVLTSPTTQARYEIFEPRPYAPVVIP